jgi:hypothetical protein
MSLPFPFELAGGKEDLEAARLSSLLVVDPRYELHLPMTVAEERAREVPPSEWRELPMLLGHRFDGQ